MDFENLKLSSNKYDRYIYESINKTCNELDLDETQKELFLKNYVEKKNKKYEVQYKTIEGFSGPYRGKFLKGYSPQNKGKNYDTLKEALEAFKKDDYAKGITMTRTGKYTIRISGELNESTINSNGSCEISWVVEDRKIVINQKCGGQFEIIKIKGLKYYFNVDNYKIYNLDGSLYGYMEAGLVKKNK
jgi:hypothetical protein